MALSVVPAIPAAQLVNVIPSVLAAGGNALDLIGLFLTRNTRTPIGQILNFANADDVEDYFGGSTQEVALASIYFNGPNNATVAAGSLLIAQYPDSAVSAWLRGGSISGLTLAGLQTLSGVLTVASDGTTHSGFVNLTTATSFSNAATIIQTALDTLVSVVGSIALNVVTGSIAPNVGTGSIAGTTLTISALAAGAVFAPDQTITGASVVNGTTIVQQLTGTAGGTGTYQVSTSQSIPSTTLTGSGGGLTVTGVTSGRLDVGLSLTGSGVSSSTVIRAGGTGLGGTGTYPVSVSQTVASGAITASGGTLTVSSVTSGTLGVNSILVGAGITVGNKITKLVTGTGGVGTYMVSIGQTVGSGTITVAGANVIVTYDSVSGGLIITSGTTGVASTISYVTGQVTEYLLDDDGNIILDGAGNPIPLSVVGTLHTTLKLTEAAGATLSQGAAAADPAIFMDSVTEATQNWVSFTTLWEPTDAGKQGFATWTNDQDNRYVYEMWDTDALNLGSSGPSVAVAFVNDGALSGVSMIHDSTGLGHLAAFEMGWIAALDFTRRNGRQTAAFKGQDGLAPQIFSGTIANYLKGYGLNFYGDYTTANQAFFLYQPGSVSGTFLWKDSYVNQIWLNNQLQLAIMVGMQQAPSIPYNRAGYTLIESFCMDPINQAVNFGAIVSGVELSAAQIIAVNRASGLDIATILRQRGWYLQVLPAIAQVRRARTSPPCTLWYCDGGSIHQITLASIEVQ